MAKAKKYELSFLSHDNVTCRVDFLFEGYVGDPIVLTGGSRPFVLKEFNTNDDLFKPIRPLLGEVQIVTNSSGVSADSFLSNEDTDIEVNFYCNSLVTPYWSGFVLQDDFSESYENTNHILTITVSEALGLLKSKQLSNGGVEITAKSTPLQLIEYCLANTSKPLTNYFVFNNLYHSSMGTTLPDTALSLAKIDPRTFETTPTQYEDCYTVLEKINSAFNQTIFQYENKWFINRIEELYTSGNLRGYQNLAGTVTTLSKRYDLEIGKSREVKPIAPQMLRFINRKPKETIVTFNYDRLAEVIKNSSFARGTLISTFPSQKNYQIDNWTKVFGYMIDAYRQEVFDTKYGALIDNYIVLNFDTDIKSEQTKINAGESVKVSIDTKFLTSLGAVNVNTIQVKLIGTSTNYFLQENGQWGSTPNIQIAYNTTNLLSLEWNSVEVESTGAPIPGQIEIVLFGGGFGTSIRYFKNLQFEILNRVDGFFEGLTGIECKFIKSANIKFNNNYDLYLNDYISEAYKGLLYENNGTTPTDFEWYRYRFNGERQSFKKQNAIARWSHDRYDRDKIDATFYGLKWDDAGTTRIIGLPNTIKLMDDSPNKIFYISNLKEIDFSSAIWTATIEEVWDNTRDGAAGITRQLSVNVNTGTYAGIVNVKYLPSSNPDFVVTGDDEILYQGAQSITKNLTVTVSGYITAYTGATPVAVDFYLKKNGTTINTQTISITTTAPFFYTINLSPATATLIDPQDVFKVTFMATQIGKSIDGIQFIGGIFESATYTIPNELNYDPYTEKYLFK